MFSSRDIFCSCAETGLDVLLKATSAPAVANMEYMPMGMRARGDIPISVYCCKGDGQHKSGKN
jgi:hypothetical protein